MMGPSWCLQGFPWVTYTFLSHFNWFTSHGFLGLTSNPFINICRPRLEFGPALSSLCLNYPCELDTSEIWWVRSFRRLSQAYFDSVWHRVDVPKPCYPVPRGCRYCKLLHHSMITWCCNTLVKNLAVNMQTPTQIGDFQLKFQNMVEMLT